MNLRGGTPYRLGSEAIVRLCGLASLPLLTRSLGSDGYGVIVGAGSIAGFFSAIATLGLSYHVGRIVGRGESPASRRLLRRLLLIAGGSGSACALALAAASPELNRWFLGHPAGAWGIAASGGAVLAACVDGILLEWLRQRERFATLSAVQAGAAIVQLSAIVATIAAGGGPVAVVLCASIVQLLRVSAMALLIGRTPRAMEPSGPVDPPPALGTCLRDGLLLTLGALGAWGLAQGGRLALGDAAAIGGFGVAAAVASLPGAAGSACALPLYPALVRAAAAGRPRAAASAIRRFSTAFQTLALPGAAIALALAHDALPLVAGRDFTGLGLVCALLMLAAWMEMSLLPLAYATAARGWASRTRNAQLAAAGLNLAIACACVPRWGAVGAAAALVSGQFAMLALLAWGLRHAAFPWRSLMPRGAWWILAAAIAGGSTARLLSAATWPALLGAGICSLAAIAAALTMSRISRKR